MAGGGAGGKEVGRLSIRVVPDMDGFRERVEAGAAAAGKDIHIPVDADTGKAKAKIKEVTDHDYDTRVDLDVDARGFREKVAALAKAASAGQKVKIKVEADTFSLDLAKKKIDRFLTENAIENGRAGQRLQEAMRNRGPQRQKFNLELDPAFDYNLRQRLTRATENASRAAAKAAERELAKIGSDRGDNRSNLSRMMGGIGGMFSNIRVPDLAPNIGGLGAFGSIGIIVAGLSLLAPALAMVSQALVGLPALVTGFALPIGVLAFGFKGIKQALDDSGILKDEQKFDKNGKPKGKGKQGLGSALADAQAEVSSVFATGLKPVFQQIAGILPDLMRGLPFVAGGLVKIAEGMGNILSTPAFTEGFDRFTNSVGTMLTNLSPAFQLFTSAMSNLVFNVGDHLPGFANTMTEWAGEFQNWVGKISTPKKDWFGQDVPNSSTLDQAVSNMKPVLNSIKDFVGDLLSRGLDLANDPNLVNGIKEFMTGLEHLAEEVSRMGPVFEGLAHILSMIPGAPSQMPDPKAPYGTKPGPAGSGTTIPITHDEAMQHDPSFGEDPGGWFDSFGSKFKTALKNIPKTIWDDAGIAGGWIRSLFSGAGPTGTAGADSAPFNPGTKVVPGQAPIPVVPVAPAGGPTAGLQQLLLPGNAPKTQGPPPMLPGVQGATQPPEIKAPKIEAPKPPPGSDQIWVPLLNATHSAGATINGEVSSWAGVITAALSKAAAGAAAQGEAVGAGFAAGITASTYRVQAAATQLAAAAAISSAIKLEIKSPSRVMHRQGEMFAQGFDDGMTGGFQGVIEKASALSQKVTEAMQNGGVLSPELKADTTRELAAIGIQYDKLKDQYDDIDPKDKAGRKGIKGQMDQLRELRETLGGGKKESDYNSKYGKGAGQGDSMSEAAQMITTALAQGIDAIKSFGMAGVQQAESDLGMSGNGVVEQLGNFGIGFLTQQLNKGIQNEFGMGNKGGDTHYHGYSQEDIQRQQRFDDYRGGLQHAQRSNS